MFTLCQAFFKVPYINQLIYSLQQPFEGSTIIYLTDEEIKAHRDLVDSPRSHSWNAAEPEPKPSQFGSRGPALKLHTTDSQLFLFFFYRNIYFIWYLWKTLFNVHNYINDQDHKILLCPKEITTGIHFRIDPLENLRQIPFFNSVLDRASFQMLLFMNSLIYSRKPLFSRRSVRSPSYLLSVNIADLNKGLLPFSV